ncbi:MAG: 3-deoxy-D-manno-octulosonic acid transferase, partial [Steroidobacteraceae bacterium]
LAPRHPERFDAVAALAADFAAGLPEPVRKISGMPEMRFWRRSALTANQPTDLELRGGVLLLDSIGELAAIYSLATLAFVGGSLAPHGGHNILEPAHFGKPILVGPHTENFRDIIRIFTAANALRVVQGLRQKESQDNGNLDKTLLDLLHYPNEREALGQRAAEVVHAHAGATERSLQALTQLLAPASATAHIAEELAAK